MKSHTHSEFNAEMKTIGRVWFDCPSIRCASTSNALSRFINNPRALFIASMACWPLVLAILAVAGSDSPRLAFYLTTLIASTGFACAELSVIDCGRSFHEQHYQLLAAFSCWAAVGLVALRLFPCLY